MMSGKVYLANAFSLAMLGEIGAATLSIVEISIEKVKELLLGGFDSAIGHESTARFLSQILGIEIPTNRQQIQIAPGDVLIVFQLQSRLPEGKVLSEEELQQIKYKFYVVTLLEP